jgi:hypothetical protein
MSILNFRKKKENIPEPPFIPGIPRLPLEVLINNDRRAALQVYESHLRGTQHENKNFTWDAEHMINGTASMFPVNGYVPLSKRRPSISKKTGKKITKKLTTMVFGHDRFPTIEIEGDDDAEDYVNELANVARIQTGMISARNKGGACGSVAISWGFKNGKPVVKVHSAAIVDVIEWQDYDERKPLKVIKCYDYEREVVKGDKIESKKFWFVRYWDDQVEMTWRDLSDETAKLKTWAEVTSPEVIQHGLGVCPVIWVQNIRDDDDIDGESDFDGQLDEFDAIDCLASATQRGTISNVDPTLVIHDKKKGNDGIIRKGSGFTIYSERGASYLTLNGDSVKSANEILEDLENSAYEEAEVVILDPNELSGAGVSAAALKTRYYPMLAKCDLLRTQYGDAIIEIMKALLESARRIGQSEEIKLEPRVVKDTEENEDGDMITKFTLVDRDPGKSSRISLKWPPYFPADWTDRKIGVETVKSATGDKAILSRESGLKLLATMLGINDIDEELERIRAEEDDQDSRAKGLFDMGAPNTEEDNLMREGQEPEDGEDGLEDGKDE